MIIEIALTLEGWGYSNKARLHGLFRFLPVNVVET